MWIIISGENLVPDSRFTLTLNHSFTVDGVMVSSSEGRSEEVKLGFPESLSFSSKFRVTDVSNSEGDTIPSKEIEITTPSKPTELTLFVCSDVSGTSEQNSGTEASSCLLIERAWEIAEILLISKTKMEIVESAEQSSMLEVSSTRSTLSLVIVIVVCVHLCRERDCFQPNLFNLLRFLLSQTYSCASSCSDPSPNQFHTHLRGSEQWDQVSPQQVVEGWYYVGEVFMKDVVEMGYDRGKNELVATTIARLSTPTRVSFFLANFLPGRCTSTARDVVRSSKPFCAVPIPDLIVGAGCLLDRVRVTTRHTDVAATLKPSETCGGGNGRRITCSADSADEI
ncbi:hypothetical protein BLNAU_20208 [Blattamonas nauphoetae]|uniref:Uncharacterized protein n=1 Tax=Blattamonas nauphoetae TaxID=2049346 RepID=A0ABQ9WZG8_9EUKA|nr:hypothetical protein BLNAU_20208 [Blattamonas nauphoetae]